MRRLLVIFLMLNALALPLLATQRSLLIGVGAYHENSGWRQLSSVNDVTLLEQILKVTGNVSTLTNEQATYKGICKAIEKLLAQTCVGDTVILHFSGHGQQMLTNDITETDLLDEAFVPYDAKSEYSSVYDGSSHLRDDVMAMYIERFRKKIQSEGLLLIIMDDCHSDSMIKGSKKTAVIYRGGAEIFGANTITNDSMNVILKRMKAKDVYELQKSDSLCNVVMVSACKSYERNREVTKSGVGYGSLSYAFAEAIKKEGMGDIAKLLDYIKVQMNSDVPSQSPQTVNTIGYTFGGGGEGNQPPPPTDESNNKNYRVVQLVAIMTSLIGIIVVFRLWKKRRK